MTTPQQIRTLLVLLLAVFTLSARAATEPASPKEVVEKATFGIIAELNKQIGRAHV